MDRLVGATTDPATTPSDEILTNSDIIATASVVVATLAFFSTAWQAWLTHRHSRLSVKPLLTWSTHRNLTATGFEVISELSNKGLGPAVVVERYFSLAGSHFDVPADGASALDSLVSQLVPPEWNCRIVFQGLPGVGGAILPGDSMRIAHLRFDRFVYDHSDELERRMGQVAFTVGYEDLYGNRNIFRTE